MSILSNYNPDCLVESYVECPLEKLDGLYSGYSPEEYARRFKLAVDIAKSDVYRATTNNKGIFNGLDAVTIATGNDYRALEAGAHAYASRNGSYQSLSTVQLDNGMFHFSLELPMTVGTVGGITAIHPLTRLSMQILGNPNVQELMTIIASVGLASNFAAVHALITSGIQKGHMKMHLSNILNQLQANQEQKEAAKRYFKDKVVSCSDVEKFLNTEVRNQTTEDRNF
jgi:hydroxymethylglutaryl-CoA reductase